jgi:hypothetical protein
MYIAISAVGSEFGPLGETNVAMFTSVPIGFDT